MAVMATMGMTNAVAAGIRKYRTGSASMPLTWKNILVPPIGKNPDTGEDESLNMSGFSLPLTKTLVNIAQGNYGQAIKDYFNPLLTSAAESVVGRTTHGQDISSTADRLTHLAKSVMPINVQNLINHEGNFNLASTMGETVGIRPAPGIISRSESENTLHDAAQKNTMGYPAATKDAWARWNQMAATPAKYDQSYDKIMDEMQSNPNINPEQIKLADKRWQRQPGVERDILNDQVGPDDILQAWHEAGDDEKAAMKDAIQERLAHVDYRKISDAQQDAWDAVDKATR